MDYVFNTILAIVGAFMILSLALLVWIITLLAGVSELERELKKAESWWERASQPRERL
jgi:hypothetical protein